MTKILYIEDTLLNRRLVMKCLKKMECTYIEAINGLEGVRIAKEKQPDLILIDMHLPDIDGLEVARRIREIDTLKETPLVALTADTSGRIRDLCLDGDFNDHLTKPISRAYLLRVIQKWLHRPVTAS